MTRSKEQTDKREHFLMQRKWLKDPKAIYYLGKANDYGLTCKRLLLKCLCNRRWKMLFHQATQNLVQASPDSDPTDILAVPCATQGLYRWESKERESREPHIGFV